MSKRIFQILDEMNVADEANKTCNCAVATSFIGADKVKGGTCVKMGAPVSTVFDLMNDEVMPILILVNKKEYFKLKGDS